MFVLGFQPVFSIHGDGIFIEMARFDQIDRKVKIYRRTRVEQYVKKALEH